VDNRDPFVSQTRKIKDPICFHNVISKVLFILINLGLLLSGIVVLVDQYRDITNCEGHYRVWGIIITIYYGVLTLASYWRWSWFITMVPRDQVVCLLLLSIGPLFISTTGYYYVLDVPEGCHTDNISEINRWSVVVVVFNSCITLLLWIASIGLCCYPDRFKTNTTILDLVEVEDDMDPNFVAYL
jgi:hypothetical protein